MTSCSRCGPNPSHGASDVSGIVSTQFIIIIIIIIPHSLQVLHLGSLLAVPMNPLAASTAVLLAAPAVGAIPGSTTYVTDLCPLSCVCGQIACAQVARPALGGQAVVVHRTVTVDAHVPPMTFVPRLCTELFMSVCIQTCDGVLSCTASLFVIWY